MLSELWDLQIMMFQTRVLLGGMDVYDRYQDWRLDVDSMTYEVTWISSSWSLSLPVILCYPNHPDSTSPFFLQELLELEDRIGYVSTGLREDEIVRSLRKVKPSAFDTSPLPFSSGTERKCSICQVWSIPIVLAPWNHLLSFFSFSFPFFMWYLFISIIKRG